MQKEYEKFKEVLNEKKGHKDELQADIDAKQKEVLELGEAYKQALISNDDKQADKLQADTDTLQRTIKRNQDRFNLTGTNDAEVEQQALKVLDESNKGIEALDKEAKQIVAEYDEMRIEMLKKSIELENHKNKGTPYREAMRTVINSVEGFAEAESKKQGSKLRHQILPNGKAISSYNNPARIPELKTIEDHHLRQAKATIQGLNKK